MTIPPNRLRYVECVLPDGLAKVLIDFEDYFDVLIKPYFDYVDGWMAENYQPIVDATAEQIALREQLLAGTTNDRLSSLQALEDNLRLTNPARDPDDPETIRQDERKLGAANIVMLAGRPFKLLQGKRIEALRRLWYAAGKDYQTFLAFGNAVVAGPEGSYLFLQFDEDTGNFPYVDKSFQEVETITGIHRSLYYHHLFWNSKIEQSSANNAALQANGFSSTQILDMLGAGDPQASVDARGSLTTFYNEAKTLAKVLLLPASDPLRQPPWETERMFWNSTLEAFLGWRLENHIGSYIIDPTFWDAVRFNLSEDEMRELFEHRPEVADALVPTPSGALDALFTDAVNAPTGTPLINSYMLKIPANIHNQEKVTACAIFNVGLALWNESFLSFPEFTNDLAEKLVDLQGSSLVLIPGVTQPCAFSPLTAGQLKTMFKDKLAATPDQMKAAVDTIYSGNILSEGGIILNDQAEQLITFMDPVFSKKAGASGEAVVSDNPEGLKSKETFSMLLQRRMHWGKYDLSCTPTEGKDATGGPDDPESQALGKGEGSISNEGAQALGAIGGGYLGPAGMVAGSQAAVAKTKATPGAKSSKSVIVDVKTGQTLGSSADPSGKVDRNGLVPIDGNNRTFNQVVKDAKKNSKEGYTPPSAFAAKDRRVVRKVDNGPPPNRFKGSFNISCVPKLMDEFGKRLEALRTKLEAKLLFIINMLKEMVLYIQDKIDSFILKIQLILDHIFGVLEKLLTLDFNLNGAYGFQNGLLKCSWSLDLGLKLNLLGLLMKFLEPYIKMLSEPLSDFLQKIKDWIRKVFCIPIEFLQNILGNPVLAKILAFLGCTIKDFKLPDAILDLLRLLEGLFSLRSLVFAKATDDWLDLNADLDRNARPWAGLSQFAGICSPPPLNNAVSKMADVFSLTTSDLPIQTNNKAMAATISSALGI